MRMVRFTLRRREDMDRREQSLRARCKAHGAVGMERVCALSSCSMCLLRKQQMLKCMHDDIHNTSCELVKGNLGAGTERYVLP